MRAFDQPIDEPPLIPRPISCVVKHSVEKTTREFLRQDAEMECARGVLRHERRIAERQWGETRDTRGCDARRRTEDVQKVFYWPYRLR